MSWWSDITALLASKVNSQNVRYEVHPAGAGVAIVSDGVAAAWAFPGADAHVEIVAAAIITAPCQIAGLFILANTLEAACYADIAIGVGPDGADIDRFIASYFSELAPAAGVVRPVVFVPAPYPVRVATSLRLSGRIRKSSVASGVGVTVKVLLATAVGT